MIFKGAHFASTEAQYNPPISTRSGSSGEDRKIASKNHTKPLTAWAARVDSSLDGGIISDRQHDHPWRSKCGTIVLHQPNRLIELTKQATKGEFLRPTIKPLTDSKGAP